MPINSYFLAIFYLILLLFQQIATISLLLSLLRSATLRYAPLKVERSLRDQFLAFSVRFAHYKTAGIGRYAPVVASQLAGRDLPGTHLFVRSLRSLVTTAHSLRSFGGASPLAPLQCSPVSCQPSSLSGTQVSTTRSYTSVGLRGEAPLWQSQMALRSRAPVLG